MVVLTEALGPTVDLRAVVRGEPNKGVVVIVVLNQGVEDAANSAIELAEARIKVKLC
jgi:hypothetical protein